MTLNDMNKKWKQFPIATAITSLSAFHIALLAAVIYYNVSMQAADIQSIAEFKMSNTSYIIQAVLIGVILFAVVMLSVYVLLLFCSPKQKPIKNTFLRTYITEIEIAYWNSILCVNLIAMYTRYQAIHIRAENLEVYRQMLSDIRMKEVILCSVAMILLYLPNLAWVIKRRKNESLIQILRERKSA